MPRPTLQVSPPEAGPPPSPSRFTTFTRALKLGGNSGNHPENTLNPADHLSIQELESRNASNASLAASLNQGAQGERPPIPAKHPARHHESNASFRSDQPGSHRHRESTAKSFLSVSPAIGPPNAAATLPLTSLYLVSGLPKSPQTWTLADPDSITGVHHSEGAVGRFWRAEVLGSSVTPGVGGKKKKKGKGVGEDGSRRLGTLSKSDLGKMLSKALKLSFTREVEIIASTLQPASSVHTFTFQLPTGSDGPATSSNGILRTSMLSTTTAGDRSTIGNFPYMDPAFPRPSSTYLGPAAGTFAAGATAPEPNPVVTYHGVCLTVWSHADEDRSTAIRRTLETAARNRPGTRSPKVSTMSMETDMGKGQRRRKKKTSPWSATEAEESEADFGESDIDGGLNVNTENPGASTLFLPPNTVFWLPYALTLVSRHPIYDLMRDYLTLSWARFSKDVQSHTLQISKILEHPAPRAGEVVKIDAGVAGESMEVVCRFPGGLDFGRGLVDVNFTMWPLFRCLNLDNILTICELALAPTGRVLFLSRHPAMLGIAVSTLKYLVELRGWNGVALPIVHARDAKIYLEDPGPWIIGLPTETRYITRIQAEVCICDLDINYVNCSAPPAGVVSVKAQRDKFRRILMTAFDSYFHPDHSVPSEFKEAFPAGRFRPLCKIQTKKGSSSTAVAESIRAPEWWHQTRVVQAFDAVLRDKYKKPTLLKRLAMMGMAKRQGSLTPAERLIQISIRKRASAFVDARDDLETKIGRLSRRLNFLMTESELWRQKFVSFEEYAEALSAEAAELRAKINKEQRESKRLSGLVSITAQEKDALKAKLLQTESQHKEAMIELERMREDMEEMERERSQMIAEVEAQIERALVSIAFSDGGSDLAMSDPGTTSRPGSAMSSRPSSRADGEGIQNMRSFGTATTLADDGLVDSHPIGDESTLTIGPMSTVKEVDEASDTVGEPLSEKALRRFSATRRESHLDGLNAVDHGISERSEAVAQKMLQIQAKLEAARNDTRLKRSGSTTSHSTDSASVRSRLHPSRGRPTPVNDYIYKPPPVVEAPRSNTPKFIDSASGILNERKLRVMARTPTPTVDGRRSPIPPVRTPTTGSTIPSLASAVTTDDSDDYQSAIDHSTPASEVDEPTAQVVSYDHDPEQRPSPSISERTTRDSLERIGKRIVERTSNRDFKAFTRERASSVATSAATERPRY